MLLFLHVKYFTLVFFARLEAFEALVIDFKPEQKY